VWHDSFISVTWLIHTYAVCLPWLVHIFDMIHSYLHCELDYNTLQHTATHCTAVQQYLRSEVQWCFASSNTHCITLQHTATRCDTLQQDLRCEAHWYVASSNTHCNRLQQTATDCKRLQKTATDYNNTSAVKHTDTFIAEKFAATHYNTLQGHLHCGRDDPLHAATYTATHYNTVQCIATHCNTLQQHLRCEAHW